MTQPDSPGINDDPMRLERGQYIAALHSADGMREREDRPATQPDKATLADELDTMIYAYLVHPRGVGIGEIKQLLWDNKAEIIAALRSADGMRSALEKIYETLSSLDRPTVNQQNAFEHFSALNGTLLEIKRIAKAALAAPSVKTSDQ